MKKNSTVHISARLGADAARNLTALCKRTEQSQAKIIAACINFAAHALAGRPAEALNSFETYIHREEALAEINRHAAIASGLVRKKFKSAD
jgi:hypothetical protein